ncbi:MAG TPA: amylo-alpha-1,6-glucosidase [Usitatibacter sp.]|jgi:glycogen debranching enzyme|nr:amylo-alpha-1,6-glucosidase [Usitatibacter sp.]
MRQDSLPQEAIQVEDRWYVLATSSHSGDPMRVLKHGESFALLDRFGDMPRLGGGEHGLFQQGTRFLSRYELRIGGQRPILLNSNVRRDNSALTVDATNPDHEDANGNMRHKGTLHLQRTCVVFDGALTERVEISNFGTAEAAIPVSLDFAADYADIFEVRGYHRAERGELLTAEVAARHVVLGYRGLDGVSRHTTVSWGEPPARLTAERAEFDVRIAAGERHVIDVRVDTRREAPCAGTQSFIGACDGIDRALRAARASGAAIESSDAQLGEWLARSGSDLAMLTAGNPEGRYPYAGVPWYSVPFGRDGILTALEYLWVDPAMARGVLDFLARTQADAVEPARDAEPGKIVHEIRHGELADLGEIPFGRYYGTIDATPLFVVLAGEYYQRTTDRATLEALWPNIERALAWIDTHGDPDHDGYVEYARRSRTGLVNQGWKDSEDSVFHADGRLAEGPIALCEVQGYVYLARLHAARLARALGRGGHATQLERQAEDLRTRFERDFWCEDLGIYALALDGDKRACRVVASNAGHVLWSGIAAPERARRTGATLMSERSFSGWGVRTVAEGESRYNPMSYHDGSIWPHDNAVIAMGFARYGMKREAAAITQAMYDASLFSDLHRLPELFCGFARRGDGEGPTLYPVACSPQAWASASPFYLLKACLGLSFRPEEPRIRLLHPVLPPCVEVLTVRGLAVAAARVDLRFVRHDGEVGVQVLAKEGRVDVSVMH